MTKYFGALTLVLMLGIVLTRVFLLRQQGIQAMKFGDIDKTDFFIPPFALFYFYVVLAAAFNWPTVNKQEFFHSEIISWTGVLFCFAGLLLLLWSVVSFRQSFRVGIDADHPDRLITDGVFAFSRNPIYVAFAIILIGEFFILPNWITLHRRGHMAVPSSGVARGRLFAPALRPRLRGLLQSGETVLVIRHRGSFCSRVMCCPMHD